MYDGVTNDLERLVHERKMKMAPGFTKEYNENKLVYFEERMISGPQLQGKSSERDCQTSLNSCFNACFEMFCRNPVKKWQRLPAAATRQDAASTI